MIAVAWALEHRAIALTVCAYLIAQALIVLLFQGGALADRIENGERRAVPCG